MTRGKNKFKCSRSELIPVVWLKWRCGVRRVASCSGPCPYISPNEERNVKRPCCVDSWDRRTRPVSCFPLPAGRWQQLTKLPLTTTMTAASFPNPSQHQCPCRRNCASSRPRQIRTAYHLQVPNNRDKLILGREGMDRD